MPVTIPTSVGPVTLKEMYEGYEPGMDIQKGPYINKAWRMSSDMRLTSAELKSGASKA